MKKNYQLKYVSDDVWNNTPKEIQEKKKEYTSVCWKIKQQEGKIYRLRIEIKRTQEKLKDSKSIRTELLSELQQFSENFIPSVSPYQSVYNNHQWSVNLKIGNVKKTRYLGSDKKVRLRVDEIKELDMFYNRLGQINDLREELTEVIRDLIQKNLSIELEKDFIGVQKKLKENKLKMWDYLM